MVRQAWHLEVGIGYYRANVSKNIHLNDAAEIGKEIEGKF